MRFLRRPLFACLAVLLIAAPAAGAASLPRVPSGQRPGPPLLYERPPIAPQLERSGPFRAAPLLVSGTDAYRGGEYVYQDYLFDDRGADTVEGSGTQSQRDPEGNFSPTAGDVLYPTAGRYAGNAADLVELRIKPTADAVVYRATLNTAKDADAAVVGIGVDTNRAGTAARAWPRGAGVTSPGLDRFVTAWGTGGAVKSFSTGQSKPLPAGAVTIDLRRNQMTIRVPRSLMNPRDDARWRYVAGAGLWDGKRWKPVPRRRSPGENTAASGDLTEDAPAVYNLAFRFDEPRRKNNAGTPYTTFPGVGNWLEDKQALALKDRSTKGARPGASWDFHADVDFARLAARADAALHRPGRRQARIMSSGLGLPEGHRRRFPEYGGALQPYLLSVPPGYDRLRPAGLTFSLHSLGGNYNQFAVFSPNQLRQFGDQRGDLVATPLGRGPDGWYIGQAEADFFEVWRDIAGRFSLDPGSVALSGYSMGGYGTYRLGTAYPDLFGRAFTTVAPPGRGIWPTPVPPGPRDGDRGHCFEPTVPPSDGQPRADTLSYNLLENARWLPYMNWVEAGDQLVPYNGPTAQQDCFDDIRLRSSLWTFGPGEHLTLATVDQWAAARDFLGRAAVKRDPPRVEYAFLPTADARELGLRHDHAYWLSGLRARERRGDPDNGPPARAELDARSLAFGQGQPRTQRYVDSDPAAGPPQLNTIRGTRWTGIPKTRPRNALLLELDNLSQGTVDGRRARLKGDRPLCVSVLSDGRGRIRVSLPLPRGAKVVRRSCAEGPDSGSGGVRAAPEATADRRGVTFDVAAGRRDYVIAPSGGGGGESDTPDGDGEQGSICQENTSGDSDCTIVQR